MNLHAWVKAWEAAMAEAGYPKARLDPFMAGDDTWTYAWLSDLDAWAADGEFEHEAWVAAHRAFLTVDALRPECVEPSMKLQEMLAER